MGAVFEFKSGKRLKKDKRIKKEKKKGNMIDFNLKDYALKEICHEGKLGNLGTQYEYRVYGLKQSGNPMVLIEYPEHIQLSEPILGQISIFFAKNNIEVKRAYIESEASTVYLGLRKDIREHVVLCAAILQTIIYSLEGRLKLKRGFKVPGIPIFPTEDEQRKKDLEEIEKAKEKEKKQRAEMAQKQIKEEEARIKKENLLKKKEIIFTTDDLFFPKDAGILLGDDKILRVDEIG